MLLRTISKWALISVITSTALSANSQAFNIEFIEAAPGVYLHLGKHEEMSVENLGDIANIGFVIGTNSVAVIDPGGSPQIGQAMRNAIKALTDLPVSHVILTHIHPDHIFGGSAFAEVEHVVAHHKFSRALVQRGDFYRDAYSALFRNNDTPTSLKPTIAVTDDLRIELGAHTLLVRAHKTGHTDNDLSVFDSTSKTLWASDLIFAERIPSLDGSLTGWLKTMDELASLPTTLVIPGHGKPAPWAIISQPQRRYLNALLQQTRHSLATNKRLSDAINTIALTEKNKWKLFDLHHRGNITKAYTELEWE